MPQRLPIFVRRTKGGAYWYCYVRTPDGRRFQRALHVRADGSRESERAATAAYWHEQSRATAGETVAKRQVRTLQDALAALAAAQELAQIKDHSHKQTTRSALWLARHFTSERDAASITTEDLVTYATARRSRCCVATVLRELQVYARACKAVGITAAALPDLGDWKHKPQEPFTHDEVRRFMLACKPRHRLLAYELHFLGLRASETQKLSEPDWQRQRVWCAGTKTKKSPRWVPIPDEMFEHMQELRARDEWNGWPVYSKSQVFHFIERTSIKAGLGPRSPNDARGGVATRLAAAGVNAALRGAIMGNSERMQEQVYSQPHLLEDELLAGMQKLPRVRPIAFKPDARASANAGQTRNAGPLRVTEVAKTHDKPGSDEG